MVDTVHLKATVKKVTVDNKGESTLVPTVPLSNLDDTTQVAKWTCLVLDIVIKPETVKTGF